MKKSLCLLVSCIFLSGCATVYRVGINGYLDPSTPGPVVSPDASIFLLAKDDVKNPFFEKEIKAKAERFLKAKGFRLESYEKADAFVDFEYMMSAGKTVTQVTPVYHSRERAAIKTYDSSGKEVVSYVEYPGYMTYIPENMVYYTSVLVFEVFDGAAYRETGERKMMWIGEASSTSESSDLREAVNYLLAGLLGHFGENTRVRVDEYISHNDLEAAGLMP